MEYLYHVTYYERLGSIANEGLVPGRRRAIGGDIFDPHRAGAIFLTDRRGVFFWGERAVQWAENESDDPVGEKMLPVVLRVPARWEDACEVDAPGTRDAKADAFRCEVVIPPSDIEVWVGTEGQGEWRDVAQWREVPFDEGVDEDDGTLAFAAWGSPSPLIPRAKFLNKRSTPRSSLKNRGGTMRSSLKNRLMR